MPRGETSTARSVVLAYYSCLLWEMTEGKYPMIESKGRGDVPQVRASACNSINDVNSVPVMVLQPA